MSTHVQRLTVEALESAWCSAATTDHYVTLVDDSTHVVAAVDPAGHVAMVSREDLHRTGP